MGHKACGLWEWFLPLSIIPWGPSKLLWVYQWLLRFHCFIVSPGVDLPRFVCPLARWEHGLLTGVRLPGTLMCRICADVVSPALGKRRVWLLDCVISAYLGFYNWQTLLRSDCTILNSHQQQRKIFDISTFKFVFYLVYSGIQISPLKTILISKYNLLHSLSVGACWCQH